MFYPCAHHHVVLARGTHVFSGGLPGRARDRVAKRHVRIHVQAQLSVDGVLSEAAVQAETRDRNRTQHTTAVQPRGTGAE